MGPVLQSLLGLEGYGRPFWLEWGYSFPIVVGLGVVQSSHLRRGYRWKELFLGRSDDLKSLYLQIAQLVRVMEAVRKSELRANSSEFKTLWELIARHNRDIITERGFSCMVDILLRLRDEDLVFTEVPLVLRYDKKQGDSKMRVARTVADTLKLMARRRFGRA